MISYNCLKDDKMPKKKTHGGKRKGSGRKPTNPEGRTMLVAVTVPIALVEQLDGRATKEGWNRSEAVTEAIRVLLDKH
jgi:hypothetical protein